MSSSSAAGGLNADTSSRPRQALACGGSASFDVEDMACDRRASKEGSVGVSMTLRRVGVAGDPERRAPAEGRVTLGGEAGLSAWGRTRFAVKRDL